MATLSGYWSNNQVSPCPMRPVSRCFSRQLMPHGSVPKGLVPSTTMTRPAPFEQPQACETIRTSNCESVLRMTERCQRRAARVTLVSSQGSESLYFFPVSRMVSSTLTPAAAAGPADSGPLGRIACASEPKPMSAQYEPTDRPLSQPEHPLQPLADTELAPPATVPSRFGAD